MQENEAFVISPCDAHTRRWWLISTIVNYLAILFPLVALLCYNALARDPPKEILETFLMLSVTVVILTPGFAIMYHCAYKKFGTAWLTWSMITTPYGLIRTYFELRNNWNCASSVIMGVFVASSLWWIEQSLRLRKTNKRITCEIFERSELASSIKTQISTASTLTELNVVMHNLINEWPQHESVIKNLYKMKRASIDIL